MNAQECKELQITAAKVRLGIIEGVFHAKSGHPGGSLSSADIFTYLYFKEMNIDPQDPEKADRDRFVLSKGPVSYTHLAEDSNSMAREKEVKMVLFGGGEGGEEVLPYLDYSAIRAHPKFYVSYSDGTSILSAITRKTGLVTYYGALPGMFENLTPYNKQQFFSHFVEGLSLIHICPA